MPTKHVVIIFNRENNIPLGCFAQNLETGPSYFNCQSGWEAKGKSCLGAEISETGDFTEQEEKNQDKKSNMAGHNAGK